MEVDASPLDYSTVAQGHHPSELQPPPIRTLSLQSHPLHHPIQTQVCMTPESPAPAQSPPLHSLCIVTQSSFPQHPVRQATDFLSMTTDVHTEVDALDPSIMEFALQGKREPLPAHTSEVKFQVGERQIYRGNNHRRWELGGPLWPTRPSSVWTSFGHSPGFGAGLRRPACHFWQHCESFQEFSSCEPPCMALAKYGYLEIYILLLTHQDYLQ